MIEEKGLGRKGEVHLVLLVCRCALVLAFISLKAGKWDFVWANVCVCARARMREGEWEDIACVSESFSEEQALRVSIFFRSPVFLAALAQFWVKRHRRRSSCATAAPLQLLNGCTPTCATRGVFPTWVLVNLAQKKHSGEIQYNSNDPPVTNQSIEYT